LFLFSTVLRNCHSFTYKLLSTWSTRDGKFLFYFYPFSGSFLTESGELQTIIPEADCLFAQLRSCGWWESRQLPSVLEEKILLSIFYVSLLFLFKSPHLAKNMPDIFYFLNFFCRLLFKHTVCLHKWESVVDEYSLRWKQTSTYPCYFIFKSCQKILQNFSSFFKFLRGFFTRRPLLF
jgi:hypothetical protein